MSHTATKLIDKVIDQPTSRRHFLRSLGHLGLMSFVAAGTGVIIPQRLHAPALSEGIMPLQEVSSLIKVPELSLSLYNTHTGEHLKNHVFWAEGNFIEEQLHQMNRLFRDHRTGEAHPIDTDLLKLLVKITELVETKEPIHLVSGYRSPKTNKTLASNSSGVARNSQHLYGKAADIIIPGRSMKQLQRAAKSLKAGGVGRYPSFVHVDTGRVRSWGLA